MGDGKLMPDGWAITDGKKYERLTSKCHGMQCVIVAVKEDKAKTFEYRDFKAVPVSILPTSELEEVVEHLKGYAFLLRNFEREQEIVKALITRLTRGRES